MDEITGREILLEVLRSEGVRHIFGNPGSTELPLIDALASAPDLAYVLALQEATVVGMADGYAQATGRPAFVNLHTAAGLGNAVGNLTNARANGTPLVVTAGQQDERHLATDPLLSGPLTDLAAPTTKWAHEVRSLAELGVLLRRGFADARKPPTGPVFLSLRMDLLERSGPAGLAPPPAMALRTDVAAPGLEEVADLLRAAAPGRLAIVAGEEVGATGSQHDVAALAAALGAPVYGAPLHSNAVYPPMDPMWAGMLAPAAAAIRATLAPYDLVLYLGGQPFMVYPRTDGSPLPDGCDLIHVSPDPTWLGRGHRTRLGLSGHPGATARALLPLLGEVAGAADAVAAAARAASESRASLEGKAEERYGPAPMAPMAAAHALVRALPPGTDVVDEAITTGGYVRGFHHDAVGPGGESRYFFCRGGGLGWGMPAACGVSLGRDRSPVLCVVGDGSAMYSPQALWTAARERLPVVFAVVDNGQYRILKDYLRSMGGESVRTGTFVGMDLEPRPDFLALAASMGVASTPVESTADLGDAVRAAVESGAPHLLHVPITAP